MTRLILIRHSQTDYNLESRYCGFKDIGLNRLGIENAKKIKNRLKRFKIDKVICSDLRRCWQTAKIIFGNIGCDIEKNRNLREIDFGKWEGFDSKQALKKYSLIYKRWIKDPFSVDIPSGEKIVHFINRVKKELKKIVKDNPNKTVVLVIHFGPIRVILNTLLGVKRKDFWCLKLNPDAIHVIKYSAILKPQLYRMIRI